MSMCSELWRGQLWELCTFIFFRQDFSLTWGSPLAISTKIYWSLSCSLPLHWENNIRTVYHLFIWGQEIKIQILTCLSYFSIAVKRHQDQGNLQNKTFNWGIMWVSCESTIITVRSMAALRQADMMVEQWLRAYILTCKLEAQRKTGAGVDLWNFKAHLKWHISSDKVNPSLVLPKPFSPTVKQVFK